MFRKSAGTVLYLENVTECAEGFRSYGKLASLKVYLLCTVERSKSTHTLLFKFHRNCAMSNLNSVAEIAQLLRCCLLLHFNNDFSGDSVRAVLTIGMYCPSFLDINVTI